MQKPNWTIPVVEEAAHQFEGYSYYTARTPGARNAEWGTYVWVAFDSHGGSEDGRAYTPEQAHEYAKAMIRSYQIESGHRAP